MARIRTIKPEFWDSPSTAVASPWARLAYIAMWNWADDYGRGTANLKELEGFIFPNDTFPQQWSGNTVTFRSIAAELSACFGVVFYESGGRPYYAIPSWEKHQRNEKRAAQSRYPEPPTARVDGQGAETPTLVAVNPNISAPGTGEQGNRGTDSMSAGLPPAEPPILDPDKPAPKSTPNRPIDEEFPKFYAAYPRKNAPAKAKEAYRAARKEASFTAIMAGLETYKRTKPDYADWAMPATWLNGDRWLDEPAAVELVNPGPVYFDAADLDD